MISLIGAMDRNRNIGLDGDMPWGKAMKGDLELFRQHTDGHMIIMGRKTFESLPGILPNREHVVLTRDVNYHAPHATVFHTVQDIFDYIEAEQRAYAAAMGTAEGFEVFVIGGAQLYEQFMPYADNLYLTKVHAYLKGDTKFPDIVGDWRIDYASRVVQEASKKDKYGFTFMKYERIW